MSDNLHGPSLLDRAQLDAGDAQALPVWAKKARVKGINTLRLVAVKSYIPESAMSSMAIEDIPEPFGKNSKSPPIIATSSNIL